MNYRDGLSVTEKPGGGGRVKQAGDGLTLELPGLDAVKRGRGRPRKVDALTSAQRAKRYREMQKLRAAADAMEARYRALRGRTATFPEEALPDGVCRALNLPLGSKVSAWEFPASGRP